MSLFKVHLSVFDDESELEVILTLGFHQFLSLIFPYDFLLFEVQKYEILIGKQYDGSFLL